MIDAINKTFADTQAELERAALKDRRFWDVPLNRVLTLGGAAFTLAMLAVLIFK